MLRNSLAELFVPCWWSMRRSVDMRFLMLSKVVFISEIWVLSFLTRCFLLAIAPRLRSIFLEMVEISFSFFRRFFCSLW